ncbi:cyclin-O-like isoform X2 [Gigantopelta aegis]|uniref:cyclin-O-like isoform X2 n=1 Tax=Gigantopelta aegis TaxID=1735272 RepID=UPI001B88A7CC|nr:cyclin-O-like isoform X2 [Gigantopelta aegis]
MSREEIDAYGQFATPLEAEATLSTSHDSGYGDDFSQSLECYEQYDPVVEWKARKLSLYSPVRWTPFWPMGDIDHAGFEGFEEDIYRHRLSVERKFHPVKCLSRQSEISPVLRGLLVNWVTSLCQQNVLSQSTLFLSVNIIDRVFSVIFVASDCLPLLGITSLLVAAKLEEVSPPEIADLVEGMTYTRASVKELEQLVLMAIKFDLMVPTSLFFLEFFAAACTATSSDADIENLRQARAFARCVLHLSLQDYDLCQFRPSLLALCMWKAAVRQIGVSDGEYYPSGIYCTRGRYDKCLSQVKSFTRALMDSYPDIFNISEKFRNLQGVD